jgi:Leucine-rich repeat (LRR) protein
MGLTELSLRMSNIEALHRCIGNLQNLEILDLSYSRIRCLPDTIGNLRSLRKLYLNFSDLECDPEVLWTLTQRCRRLGSFGYYPNAQKEKVAYALARNRARLRTSFGSTVSAALSSLRSSSTSDSDTTRIIPSLWPVLLSDPEKAFVEDVSDRPYKAHGGPPWKITKHDAVYQLLIDGRESLLGFVLAAKR